MSFSKTIKSAAFVACTLAAASAVAVEPEFFARKAAPGQPSYPFSEAVRVGDMLYLSGDIAVGADGDRPRGGAQGHVIAKRKVRRTGGKGHIC